MTRDGLERAEQAAALREQGRLDEAETAYRALLETWPGWFLALAGLGLCARRRGDLAEAGRCFAAAVAAAPEDRWMRLEHAVSLRELGRWAEAEAEYNALLAAHPGWFHALAGLGLCARRRGEHIAAARCFADAARIAPQDRWIGYELATTLRELGRLDAAEAKYAVLRAVHPDWFLPVAGMALCAQARGDLATAERRFAAALALEPHDVGARLEHAATLRGLGRAAEAAAEYRALLADQPDLPYAAFGLGLSLRLLGDRDAALAAFRDGYRRWPQAHFLAELTAEAQALGRLDEAEGWLEDAAAQPGLAALVLTLRGEQARLAQRHPEALELLGRALAQPGAPQGAGLALAHTLAELGRLDEALAALDRIATPEAAATRIYLLRRAGRYAEALSAARAAPLDHYAVWLERFETERLTDIGPALDALLAAAPAAGAAEQAGLCHARGVLAEQRWQLAAAGEQFRAALALDDTLGWTHDALARIGMKRCDAATARTHLRARQQLEAAGRQRRGHSPHLTHTHMGQVLDEFLLDPAAVRAAADALALADPDRRVAALLRLARAAPGHTPTAMALAIALRLAGRLTPPPASEAWTQDAIPQRIAQYWDDAAPPADVAAVMRSWAEHNPGHAYRCFGLASAGEYLQAHAAPEVVAAYRRARGPAMKADLFRLAWLLREGGVYADADDCCLAPLATLLPPGAGLVLYQEEHGTLGNNFVAAVRHHPVLALALRHAVAAINRGDDDMVWLATGPGLMTRAFAEALATAPMAWLDRACVLDRHELARGVAVHCMLGYKVTPKHWIRGM